MDCQPPSFSVRAPYCMAGGGRGGGRLVAEVAQAAVQSERAPPCLYARRPLKPASLAPTLPTCRQVPPSSRRATMGCRLNCWNSWYRLRCGLR